MHAGKRKQDRAQLHGLQLPKPNVEQVLFSQGVQQSKWSEIVLHWTWNVTSPNRNKPIDWGLAWEKPTEIWICIRAPSLSKLIPPASELHSGPPYRKLLPAAATTKNGHRNHLHLRLYLLNKNLNSKFPNSWPKSITETKSLRIPKNSYLKYFSMNKIRDPSWWGFAIAWCNVQHSNQNAMKKGPTSEAETCSGEYWSEKVKTENTCTNR